MFLTKEEVLKAATASASRSTEDMERILANYMPQGTFTDILRQFAQTRASGGDVTPQEVVDQTTAFMIGFEIAWEVCTHALKGKT